MRQFVQAFPMGLGPGGQIKNSKLEVPANGGAVGNLPIATSNLLRYLDKMPVLSGTCLADVWHPL